MKNAVDGRQALKHIVIAAMFMALNVVMSSFGIPVPGGHLYLNDIIIGTAALIFDPFTSFAIGGVGAFLGDVFFYPTPMYVTLVVRGLQAIAISVISRYTFKNNKKIANAIALAVGGIINVAGYSIGRAFFYATPSAAVLKLPTQFAMAALGAVVAPILVYKLGVGKMYNRFMKKKSV